MEDMNINRGAKHLTKAANACSKCCGGSDIYDEAEELKRLKKNADELKEMLEGFKVQ